MPKLFIYSKLARIACTMIDLIVLYLLPHTFDYIGKDVNNNTLATCIKSICCPAFWKLSVGQSITCMSWAVFENYWMEGMLLCTLLSKFKIIVRGARKMGIISYHKLKNSDCFRYAMILVNVNFVFMKLWTTFASHSLAEACVPRKLYDFLTASKAWSNHCST